MIVRELRESDTASIMKLTEAMHSESPHYSIYPYDPDKVLSLVKVFLTNNDFYCVVAERDSQVVGFMAVAIIQTFFGTDDFVEDLSFYVLPVSRGTSAALRMVKFAEAWGISRGAKAIRVGVTTGVRTDSSESFFLKLGYEETGKMYTKLISPFKLNPTH